MTKCILLIFTEHERNLFLTSFLSLFIFANNEGMEEEG